MSLLLMTKKKFSSLIPSRPQPLQSGIARNCSHYALECALHRRTASHVSESHPRAPLALFPFSPIFHLASDSAGLYRLGQARQTALDLVYLLHFPGVQFDDLQECRRVELQP